MGAFLTGTTLGFPDGTQNYAPTPFAYSPVSWNENGSSTNKSLSFTNIPDWVTRITIAMSNMSVTTNTIILVQLGDSGGFETTGYNGTFSYATTGGYTSDTQPSGFYIQQAGYTSGVATLQKTYTANQWVFSYVGGDNSTPGLRFSNGYKSLSSTLTQIRLYASDTSSYFSSGDAILYFE